MTDAELQSANPAAPISQAPASAAASHAAAEKGTASLSPWLPWLAWGWVALLCLSALAELTGWDNLRLALDFQRHFR